MKENELHFEAGVLQNADGAAEEDLQRNNTLPHSETTALLRWLAALETETQPLSEAQQTALYRRALCKAGLADGALAKEAASAQTAGAAHTDGNTAAGSRAPEAETAAAAAETAAFAAETANPELLTEETAAEAAGAPRKGRLIRWQHWALSAAAALAVMALGGMALVWGGLGASMEFAVNDTAMQYSTETAADEPAADAVTQYAADLDALPTADEPAEAAVEEGAGDAALEKDAVEDAAAESTVPEEGTQSFDAVESGTNGGTGTGGTSDGLADSSDKKETDAFTGGPVYGESRAELPSGGTAAQSTVTESTFEESSAADGGDLSALLLMADGRLYRGTALVLQPDFGAGARLDSVDACVEAGAVPTENGQANFAAEGTLFARWRSGLAVLLDGEWRYFEPVE